MNKFVRILLILAILATTVSFVAAQDATPEVDRTDWPAVFSFGMFAGDDAASALTDAEPLRAYLEAQLGMPVLVNVGTTYSAVIAAMAAGQVDAMMVGPFSYVIAEREANAEAIAVVATESEVAGMSLEEINVASLRPFYYSVFVTKKGNGIATLADLQGKDVAFVDPASTSGRNAPVVRLISDIEGLETPSDVDAWLNPVFAGSHPAAVLALINDDVQVAATYEGNLIAQRTEGLAEVCGFEEDAVGVTLTQEMLDTIYADCPDGHLVVIAQSAPIPNTPFGIRADLPESFKDAVKAALLATGSDQAAFDAAGRVFIDPSQNEELASELGLETISDFYDVVRDIAAVTAEQ